MDLGQHTLAHNYRLVRKSKNFAYKNKVSIYIWILIVSNFMQYGKSCTVGKFSKTFLFTKNTFCDFLKILDLIRKASHSAFLSQNLIFLGISSRCHGVVTKRF